MSTAYLLAGFIGMAVMTPVWLKFPLWALAVPSVYLVLHVRTWHCLKQSTGAAINPILGKTAINLLIFAVLFAGACLVN
jgi:1,4-dihydroxy-2-naphthoate octaprenyltransferase